MRLLLAAALAVAATPALAEPLPVKLADGATWTLTTERVRERQRGSEPVQNASVKSSAQLTWTKAGDGGRVTTRILSAEAAGASTPELAGALGLDRPVQTSVDEALVPERIENWDEVREGLLAAITKITPDPKAAETAKGIFANLSAEQAAQVILRDQTLAAIGQGSDLELGKPVEYDDRLPNPLGGPPIQSAGRFELTAYDAAKGQAVVTWRQAFDRASATQSIAAALEAMVAKAAPDQVDKLKTAFKDAKVDRTDTCRHEIDIASGLATRAVCDTTIDIVVQGEAGRNVDRWTISQSLPKTNP